MDFKNKEEYKKSDAIFIGFLVSHLSIEEFDQLLNNLLENSTNQKILLMDNIYLEGESTKISKTDLLGNTYQIRSLEDGSSHEIMKNFYTKEDLQKLVQKYKNNFKIKQNKYYWSLEIST